MIPFTWPFRRKVKRELPLLHVHTFKTGERLYTYRVSDYGKISSRFYRNIQELSKAIQSFGMLPYQWKAACEIVKGNCLKALDGKFDRTEALTDVVATMNYFESKFNSSNPVDEEYYLALFCCFYVLEEEKETGYSELYNQKKRDLLDQEPLKRDFFLTKLQKDLESLVPTLQKSMSKLSQQVKKEVKKTEAILTQLDSIENIQSRKKT